MSNSSGWGDATVKSSGWGDVQASTRDRIQSWTKQPCQPNGYSKGTLNSENTIHGQTSSVYRHDSVVDTGYYNSIGQPRNTNAVTPKAYDYIDAAIFVPNASIPHGKVECPYHLHYFCEDYPLIYQIPEVLPVERSTFVSQLKLCYNPSYNLDVSSYAPHLLIPESYQERI